MAKRGMQNTANHCINNWVATSAQRMINAVLGWEIGPWDNAASFTINGPVTLIPIDTEKTLTIETKPLGIAVWTRNSLIKSANRTIRQTRRDLRRKRSLVGRPWENHAASKKPPIPSVTVTALYAPRDLPLNQCCKWPWMKTISLTSSWKLWIGPLATDGTTFSHSYDEWV